MKRNISLIVGSLFVILGLLASCAPAAPSPTPKAALPTATKAPAAAPTPGVPQPTPKPAAQQPRYGGILTTIAPNDAPHHDVQQNHLVAVRLFTLPAYDTLLQYDPMNQVEIVPNLAKSWEVSKDGLVYTFNLAKGVKFHDGRPFSATDVKYNLERLQSPPKGIMSPKKDLLEGVERIETPDDATVKVTLRFPDTLFILGAALSVHVIYPKHVVEAQGDMKKTVVGTGPFKLVRYEVGIGGEFKKNNDYFVPGRPYLDGVRYYVIVDKSTQFAALRTRRVLLGGNGGAALTPPQAETIKKEMGDKVVLHKYNSFCPMWLDVNVNRPPLNDVRVRKAISLALDRQAIIDVGEQGIGEVGTFMMPGGKWSRSPEEILKLPGYRMPKDADRAEAKRLLAEAGFPSGFKIGLMAVRRGTWLALSEVIQRQLAMVGIEAKLEIEEYVAANERQIREAYELSYRGIGAAADDPSEWVNTILWSFPRTFKDEKFSELMTLQKRTVDVQKRRAIAREIDDRLLELVPAAVSHWLFRWQGAWKEVMNFPTPVGLYNCFKYTEVWLAQ